MKRFRRHRSEDSPGDVITGIAVTPARPLFGYRSRNAFNKPVRRLMGGAGYDQDSHLATFAPKLSRFSSGHKNNFEAKSIKSISTVFIVTTLPKLGPNVESAVSRLDECA